MIIKIIIFILVTGMCAFYIEFGKIRSSPRIFANFFLFPFRGLLGGTSMQNVGLFHSRLFGSSSFWPILLKREGQFFFHFEAPNDGYSKFQYKKKIMKVLIKSWLRYNHAILKGFFLPICFSVSGLCYSYKQLLIWVGAGV